MAKAKLPVKKKKAETKTKSSRLNEKLEKSRESGEQVETDRKNAKIGLLQSQVESLELSEKQLKLTINEQAKTIKGLRNLIDDQRETVQKLSSQITKKPQRAWMVQQSSLEIPGNMFQICKQGSQERFPESYFPVGEILKGEIDEEATLDDIKEYVGSEYGKGSYKVKAFNEDYGHKILRGSARFKI